MSRRTRKLRKENKKARQQLRYKNQYELDEIMHYFDGAPITDYQYEQIHRDHIAMLLDGQLRGVSSKAVIGEDPLAFCEATLAEIPPAGPARAVVLYLRSFFLWNFWFMLASFLTYQAVPWARGASEGMIYQTISSFISPFLMAFVIEAGRRWNNRRVRATNWWKPILALLVIIAINIVVGIVQVAIGEFWIVIPQEIFVAIIVGSGILWGVFAELVD